MHSVVSAAFCRGAVADIGIYKTKKADDWFGREMMVSPSFSVAIIASQRLRDLRLRCSTSGQAGCTNMELMYWLVMPMITWPHRHRPFSW